MNSISHPTPEETLQKFAAAHGLGTIEELQSFPKYLMIETVALCNARCVMCPVDDWKRDARFMSPELFDKIITEITPYAKWIERVTVQLDGEPLMDKHIEQKIRALKGIGIGFVTFNSNASLMTQERSRAILQSGITEVTFSIDGATKATFEAIRRRLDYDVCVANIVGFLRERDAMRSPVRVRIRMTVQDSNRHEYADYLKFWEQRLGPEDVAYGKHLHNWANWLSDYRVPHEDEERRHLNASPCSSPWSSMVVFADGRVALCCSDYNAALEMGNVSKSSISEIWRGRAFDQVRETHRSCGRGGMKMCVDCNVWDPLASIPKPATALPKRTV